MSLTIVTARNHSSCIYISLSLLHTDQCDLLSPLCGFNFSQHDWIIVRPIDGLAAEILVYINLDTKLNGSLSNPCVCGSFDCFVKSITTWSNHQPWELIYLQKNIKGCPWPHSVCRVSFPVLHWPSRCFGGAHHHWWQQISIARMKRGPKVVIIKQRVTWCASIL